MWLQSWGAPAWSTDNPQGMNESGGSGRGTKGAVSVGQQERGQNAWSRAGEGEWKGGDWTACRPFLLAWQLWARL